MIAFFRRWRERRARTCIALAIGEQLAYEDAHGGRQRHRLKHLRAAARHGAYDVDQRTHSVLLKVRAAYAAAGKKPPKRLPELVAEALKE
jgi:hypothetical protein